MSRSRRAPRREMPLSQAEERGLALMGRLWNKYGNEPTRVDGRLFHSKLEAARYAELKALQLGGIIDDLECQPKFPLSVKGIHVCTYIADFRYHDTETGRQIVEDVKGHATEVYKLKRRLMLALHGIDVQEIRRVRGMR
jgi:Protein of unknown function (DUF1064)